MYNFKSKYHSPVLERNSFVSNPKKNLESSIILPIFTDFDLIDSNL